MSWYTAVWHWLAQAALGGTLILLAGCLAVRLVRQPVRRLRLIELTLLGGLAVPWLTYVSALPHWSAGLLGGARVGVAHRPRRTAHAAARAR